MSDVYHYCCYSWFPCSLDSLSSGISLTEVIREKGTPLILGEGW